MLRSPRRSRAALLLAGVVAVAVMAAVGWWWRAGHDPDRLFRRARADLAAGDVAGAVAAVDRLGRLRPPDEFDRLLRAQVAEADGRPDDAVAELGRIEDRHPLALVARLLVGQIEKKRSRLRPAEAAYLAAAALGSRSDKPHRELVYIYSLQHRRREVDAQLYAMSELAPLEFEYLLHWVKRRNGIWNPEQDLDLLAECVRADPGDRHSRLAWAEGFWRLNRLAEARDALAPLPDSDPEARALRAAIALDCGDEAEYDRLAAEAPADDPALAPLRARAALKEGDARSAARFFRIAHEADPADRAAAFGLGVALKALGDEAGARTYLEAARRADAVAPLVTEAASPGGKADRTLPARMAAACAAAGRPLEAAAWYRLALARDPLDAASQAALRRLERQIADDSARDRPATALRP